MKNKKNNLLVITFVVMILLILTILALSLRDQITNWFPISQSKLRQAQDSVTQNVEWAPTVHRFNNMAWALVPAGCFTMGSSDEQVHEASGSCDQFTGEGNCQTVLAQKEQPTHKVCFERPFWIGFTEVTNKEYGSSSSSDMSTMYRGPHWPRETVTWIEALTFCENRGFRLPTEAEWEYAARGPDNLVYPWGNSFALAYREQAGMLNPQNVTSIRADVSWVGAQGMGGNVMEWVADWYGPYSGTAQLNPTGPQSGDKRLARGGSWASYTNYLIRTAYRNSFDPEYVSSALGFRCAREFEETH